MTADFWSLAGAALVIGCLHTLLGPDHYIPFVAMSRAGRWSPAKTLLITILCGLGHVSSSVVLGLLGIALGIAMNRLEGVEEVRGGIAGWLLIGFGLAYLSWGIVYALRKRSHSHVHCHDDGTIHTHPHQHQGGHLHAHAAARETHAATTANMESTASAATSASAATAASGGSTASAGSVTPWILFTIFLFGPCEPLIPLLIYPAAKGSLWTVAAVTVLFSLATVLTMTVMVRLLLSGLTLVRFATVERFSHAIAGGLVLVCGIAVKLGL